jgi:hypothetical protein
LGIRPHSEHRRKPCYNQATPVIWLRFALLLPLLALQALLAACASIGAGSVNRDRLDYAEALATSWKEQMLLNIVKLRYADMPVFLDVSSVISSYQLQGQVSLTGTFSSDLTPNLPDTWGRGATVGATGFYTDTALFHPF